MLRRLAPSLLAADFANLAADLARVEPLVDFLHVDVMDGHFVPNLSFGMPVIAALRPHTQLEFDCHLMVTNPVALFGPLRAAGADLVTIHIEVHPDPRHAAAAAREAGLRFGLAVDPATPFGAVEPFVELCDMLLLMTVQPGFGGQAFIPEVLPKIAQARKFLDSTGGSADIEVDGGITPETARLTAEAGATAFVAGTAIFRAVDPVAAVGSLRTAMGG